MASSCKEGYYFCNSSQKCKKIPRGHKVQSDGELVREYVSDWRSDLDEKYAVNFKVDGSGYNVDAKIEIEEFVSFFELELDPLTIDAETLGGLFISEFGVLPKIGDKIKLENISIKVSDTDNRRIKKFIVSINK